jgi:hypothetical protein
MPENYREKEPLYNAGSGNTYTGMAGNTLAGITGNTYSGMTGNATPEYASLISRYYSSDARGP